jgi:hypothetical protein
MQQLVRTTATIAVRSALVHLMPEGGQRTARRNAWMAMSRHATSADELRQAEAAVAALLTPAVPQQRSAAR